MEESLETEAKKSSNTCKSNVFEHKCARGVMLGVSIQRFSHPGKSQDMGIATWEFFGQAFGGSKWSTVFTIK